jgi:hypothetical protein
MLIYNSITEKPKFDKDLLGPCKEVRIKAGEPINIELPIAGAPIPDVTWQKDGNKAPNKINGYI